MSKMFSNILGNSFKMFYYNASVFTGNIKRISIAQERIVATHSVTRRDSSNTLLDMKGKFIIT